MPNTSLGLDDQIAQVQNISGNATGFSTRLLTLLQRAFHSTMNPFGTSATRDTGLQSGNIPTLDASGDLPRSVFPDASQTLAGKVKFATNAQVQSRASNVSIQPSQLTLLTASTAQAGLVRRASASQVQSGANVNKFVNPSDLQNIIGDRTVTVNANPGLTVRRLDQPPVSVLDCEVTITDYSHLYILGRGAQAIVQFTAILRTQQFGASGSTNASIQFYTDIFQVSGGQGQVSDFLNPAQVYLHNSTSLGFFASATPAAVQRSPFTVHQVILVP